jgi:hypothetical protein
MKRVIPLVDITALESRQPMPLLNRDVDQQHQTRFVQHEMNFDKDLGLKGKYCFHPFNTVTIDQRGECFVCICQAWLPISVGNILDFNSFEEIVQSPRAREIQRSIIDGSYKYCDHHTCSLIIGNQLETAIRHKPDTINWINFAIDDSCNLQCPSCRTSMRFVKDGEEFDHRMKIASHVAQLISQHTQFLRFTLSADGDPFASHVYRNLMTSIKSGKSRSLLEIEIVTNGILLKSHWNDIQNIHKNIVRVRISFDAATEHTYKTIRGGSWDRVLESSEFINQWLADSKNKIDIKTEANFVVQTDNYKEMKQFVQLAKHLGFSRVTFQKIVNWNTWPDELFVQKAVWRKDHPEYDQLVAVLQDPIFDGMYARLGNLLDIK